ncbi:MAG: CocE/NonD family hydrolase [Rubrobacteraceae bacterium]
MTVIDATINAIRNLGPRVFSRLLERFLKLPPARTRDLAVTKNIEVPMRDGVVLKADSYAPRHPSRGARAAPRSDESSLPTVLVRSPCGKGGIHAALFGRPFAERGYRVLIQSCRGTGASGGTFDPFRQEADDGLDTVKWLGSQPWFSGDLATIGPSYLGFVQWALVAAIGSISEDEREAIPRPKAMAVQIAPSDFRGPVYEGESFALHTFLRWTRQRWNFRNGSRPLALLASLGRTLLGVEDRVVQRAADSLPLGVPLGDLDRQVTGGRVDYWQSWLDHDAPDDPWWDKARHSDAVAGVGAPVFLLGGRYDIFLPGLLRDFAKLREAGKRPRLIIGPWAHKDQGWTKVAIREALNFFDAHTRGVTPGEPGKDPASEDLVHLHVGGADEWRSYSDFPPPGAEPERWHLHGGGRLATDPPESSSPDLYRYDPADPTPSVGGPLFGRGAGPVDNSTLEARHDVLLYTSAPLVRGLEVVGLVEAELWVSSSLEHTDFFVRFCDVGSEGRSVNVCDGLLRVAPGRPEPGADGTLHLQIELWPTAYRFERGHKLRLQVSSGAHPRLARNPGSGQPLATATRQIPADQEIFHDPEHPSSLTLSVLG